MKKIVIAGAVLIVAVLIGYTGTTLALNNERFLAKPDANGAAYNVTKVFEFKRDWSGPDINSQGPCREVIDNYRATKNYADTIDKMLKNAKKGSEAHRKLTEQKKKADELLKKALQAVEDCANSK